MQFFTGLVLDRVGIALQVADVLVEAIVLFLKLLHLLLENLCFFALVGESSEPVMSEDDAIGHNERQAGGRDGGRAATPQIDAVLRGPGEFGQFGREFRFGWCGSQFQASMGVVRAERSLEVSRIPS